VSAHLEFEEWAPFPLEQVFLFFANPQNLPRIMPPVTGTRVDDLKLVPTPPPLSTPSPEHAHLAGVGSEIFTSFLLLPPLPFRASWIARITEFEWNHQFTDIQAKGPFRRWQHRHEFASEVRSGILGTTVRDVVAYEAGFGIAGVLAEKLFISAQLRRTFAHRQRVLASLLGSR
jgi:ligand-binding SRPBCC domain-containing protein